MGLVMSEFTHRPYVPLGCAQQGRATPTKLCAAHLDRRQAEPANFGKSLGDLLLSSGAVEGPYKAPHPITRWTVLVRRFHRALLALVLPRNHKERA